ncbi:MAG TPA: BMP family ABC transporter substrate-binding protein [Mycobacteriales bacterium]|nr:BMP family ABC transporter substrate-binding protein [Mycobacteriales bacterium]
MRTGLLRSRRFVAAAAVSALALTACGGSDSSSDTDTASGDSGASSDVRVALAYDIGGRGDQSFNDAAAAGLDRAVEELGVEVREAEAGAGESDSAKEERLRLLASSGFNPVIAVGFAYSGPLAAVAEEFPDTTFAIVDDAAAEGDNISNLVFAEEQGSFLVGVAAALKSPNGNVGFIGGVEVPLIKKFEAGFKAGAEAVKPGITVQTTYLTQPPDFTGFNDPAKGRTAAQGMFDSGADVVYHAAGGSGSGLFEAADAAGKLAIGVDSDQYVTAGEAVQDVILTSMLKKVDVAVFDFINSAVEGDVQSGQTVYDLEAGGVDYSTSGGKVDDITAQLEDYKQKIISGEITVPTS